MCRGAPRAVRIRGRQRSPLWEAPPAAVSSSMAPPATVRASPSRRRICLRALGASPRRSRAPVGQAREPPTRSPVSAPPASPQSSERVAMDEPIAYLRDGAAIYQRSFAIIRAEAQLSDFSPEQADIVVRMIHACGLVEAAQHIVFGGDLVGAARRALAAGAPILCD